MFEKVFKLKENNTNVKTEVVAGLTTFMTMAYIIALNPNLLTNFDTGSTLWNGVFMAACIASAIGIGLISYTIMKIFGGKAKEVSTLTYIISLLFIVKFFLPV